MRTPDPRPLPAVRPSHRGALLLGLAGALTGAAGASEDPALFASDGAAGDYFGSVAASQDFVAVGAQWDDDLGTDSGSVYLFQAFLGNWNQSQKLLAPDGTAGDWFGAQVAMDGDVMIVAAAKDDDNGTDSGSAYVYRRSGGTWAMEQKLVPADGAANDLFGASVAVSGDTLVVGAYKHQGTGAAYVYRHVDGVWLLATKLWGDFGLFGFSVAASGDRIAVGGFEGVTLFREEGGSWSPESILVDPGGAGSIFGISVALDGVQLAVGAWLDDTVATNAGAVHMYQHDGAQWVHQVELTPFDGTINQYFGGQTALADGGLLVGVPADMLNTGAVYQYELVDGNWGFESKLLAPDATTGDGFGGSVAFGPTVAWMGAGGHDGGTTDAGAVFGACLDPEVQVGFEPGSDENAFAAPESCPTCPPPFPNVYPFSGEVQADAEDLRIPGRGSDFVMGRKYRSRLGSSTAMGNGWDFTYDVWLEAAPGALILHDGNTRRDFYELQPNGTYTRPEFYREIVEEPDGSFTVRFANGGVWELYALDHPTAPGRLEAIEDRNGNRMTMHYDLQGQLAFVRDTLHTAGHPREVHFTYDASGHIVSVSDWTGRVVRYEYYQDGDLGGSAGDLKSATTPPVIPDADWFLPSDPEHHFPNGKTTVYTYSTGFANEELNHNLLTITDPEGQTFLRNVYSDTTDDTDFIFDHVVRQAHGAPDDWTDFTYVPLNSSAGNGFSIVDVIVNDRVGNVTELLFDEGNRLVVFREYTGRWDEDAPATLPLSPLIPSLRPGDPAFFETRYEYNEDSRVTREIAPNGTETVYVYELELDSGAHVRTRGNLREVHRYPGTHVPAGDQAAIIELFEYVDGAGCGCGTNFVSKWTDGRGMVTNHTYDSAGNRIHTDYPGPGVDESWEYNAYGQPIRHVHPADAAGYRREDVFEYHEPVSGHQYGYVASETLDAQGEALTHTFDYDRVGDLIRMVDAKGHATDYMVNQLGQTVRTALPPAEPGHARIERDVFFDANDNVSSIALLNVDEGGNVLQNAWLTTSHQYEILNRVVSIEREVDALTTIVTEFAYDANRNRILVRSGEAVNGNQPANVEEREYDERDKLYRVVRGPGSPERSTSQFDYDGNGNILRAATGLEGAVRETLITFDAYDRPTSLLDSMGNVTDWHYDAGGNIGGEASPGVLNPFGVRRMGQLVDMPGSTGNVPLAQIQYGWDGLGRMVLEQRAHFDLNSQIPVLDGTSTRTLVYSPNSQLVVEVDDNGHSRSWSYDTVGRLAAEVDAVGNERNFEYDAESNLLRMVEVERSTSGQPEQAFTTDYQVDALDRVTSIRDSAGNTTRFGSDSRGNRTSQLDALGNLVEYSYDGLGRLTETRREMTDDGSGGGAVVGALVTRRVWDDTSRLVRRVDPNGNVTRRVYDALDRPVEEHFADGTGRSRSFDVHGGVVETLDANGTRVTATHDQLGRLTGRVVDRASQAAGDPVDVLGTTFETFRYDGRSNLVFAEDDDSRVLRTFESLGGILSETLIVGDALDQTAGVTLFERDGVSNLLAQTYPGGRRVTFERDDADRLRVVREDTNGQGAFLAGYEYVGDRVERLLRANGVESLFEYDGMIGVPGLPGDRGVRQVVRALHRQVLSGDVLDEREYRWDRLGSKRLARVIEGSTASITHYSHDSAGRLVSSRILTRRGGGGLPGVGFGFAIEYSLDDAGNREHVDAFAGGPVPSVGEYTMTSGDQGVNQYSSAPTGERDHDPSGNLILIRDGITPLTGISYDYRNRMVELVDDAQGRLHAYAYDVFSRRIARVTDVGTGAERETRFFYRGFQVIEEQDEHGITRATYTHGVGIDGVLTMARGGAESFYLADDLGSVVALTDGSGDVVERYKYGDFGEPTVLDPAGQPLPDSAFENPLLFTGRPFDAESGWYYLRHRYLDPAVGRFTVRDPLGIWGDAENLGNGYAYVGNRPASASDPMGLDDDGVKEGITEAMKWAQKAKDMLSTIAVLFDDIDNGRVLRGKLRRVASRLKCFSGAITKGGADVVGILLQMSESLDTIAEVAPDLGELVKMGDAIQAQKILSGDTWDQPEELLDYKDTWVDDFWGQLTGSIMNFCTDHITGTRKSTNNRIRMRNAVRSLLSEGEIDLEDAHTILSGPQGFLDYLEVDADGLADALEIE